MESILKIVFWWVYSILCLVTVPFVIMLLIGVVHSQHPAIPAIGYGTAFVGYFILWVAVSPLRVKFSVDSTKAK